MKIEVKQKHINKGIRGDGYFCPVALALVDKGYEVPSVGAFHIIFFRDNVRITIKTPRSVQRFIKKFDNEGKKKVKPFNFILKEKK